MVVFVKVRRGLCDERYKTSFMKREKEFDVTVVYIESPLRPSRGERQVAR